MTEPVDLVPEDTEPSPPEEEQPTTRRRVRRDVVIGAAALAAAAFIGKGLSNGKDAPSPSHSPSPTVGRTAHGGPIALPAPRANDVAACPPKVRCLTQDAGNGLALEPVRSRLPNAKLIRFHTVLLRTAPWVDVLWYRELSFRLPDGQLLQVRISAPSQPVPEQNGTTGPIGAQDFAVAPLGRYAVRVTAPDTSGLAYDLLHHIATDERLLTT